MVLKNTSAHEGDVVVKESDHEASVITKRSGHVNSLVMLKVMLNMWSGRECHHAGDASVIAV